MRVAIILPSRGLMFSRTAQEILANVQGIDYRFYFSHRKSIPECFEEPTNRALADMDITHLWYVEDDMILPKTTLSAMLAADKPVVAIDYPVSGLGQGAMFRDAGKKVLFCGTGCMLVKRDVFDRLSKPYYRSDIWWQMSNYGDHIRLTGLPNTREDVYGLHDVTFGMKLHRANIPIHMLRKKVGQRKLVELGKSGTNNGAHRIEEWTYLEKDYLLRQVQSYPAQPYGTLITVETDNGAITVKKDHAAKLIKAGLARKMPKKYSVIDDMDVDI